MDAGNEVEKGAIGCGASVISGLLGGILGAVVLGALLYIGTEDYRGNDLIMGLFVGVPVGFIGGGIIGAIVGAVLAYQKLKSKTPPPAH